MNNTNYKLIDSGSGRKLEQVGPFRLIRPAAGAVWLPDPNVDWTGVDAEFERFSGGDGQWKIFDNKVRNPWSISTSWGTMNIKITDFGHLGIFPEQSANWVQLEDLCRGNDFQVLNLFGYTGGSTLACARGGANVVHIDASKTTVQWARDNAAASGLEDAPIRWIAEDAAKFVEREVKRGNKYQGIILDPPSYGRGTKGQIWKIEEDLPRLLSELAMIAAEDLKFILLSAHSQGYTPVALEHLLGESIAKNRAGQFVSCEMTIDGTRPLPSGASSLFVAT